MLHGSKTLVSKENRRQFCQRVERGVKLIDKEKSNVKSNFVPVNVGRFLMFLEKFMGKILRLPSANGIFLL